MGRFLVNEEDDGGRSVDGLTGGTDVDQQNAGQNSCDEQLQGGPTINATDDGTDGDCNRSVEPDRCYQVGTLHEPVSTPDSSSSSAAAGMSIVPYDATGIENYDIGYEEMEGTNHDAHQRRQETWSGPFQREQRVHDQEYDSTIHEDESGNGDDDDHGDCAAMRNARINSRIMMLWSDHMNGNNGGDRRVYGHVLSTPPQDQRLYEAQLYGHGHSGTMSDDYEHDATPVPPRTSSRSRRYLLNAVLFILAGTVLAYMRTRAPPPPPPHDDWMRYLFSSTERIVGEVERISIDTGYILGGFVNNVYMDAIGLRDAILFPKSNSRLGPTCQLRVPTHDENSASTEEVLKEGIVGQERAIGVIARALDAWDIRQPSENDCAIANGADTCAAPVSSDLTPSNGKPLVLLLTGPEGVGKAETARLLARLMFRHCATEPRRRGPMPGGVLQINGPSFSDNYEHTLSYTSAAARLFKDKINEHVLRQQGAGAVVILKHFESVPARLLRELVGFVQSLDAGYERDSSLRWDNVLFILTSDLGADKVFKSISAYEGMEYLPENDLSLAVRNEIDDHFGTSTGLGTFINSVAVFMPLRVPQVEFILRNKVRQLSAQHKETLWKRLVVTERTLRHFVGMEHIDYLSMKKRDSESILLTFSKRGAHTLDDGICMQTLRSIRRRVSPRPAFVAVFDYDPDTKQATMKWCTDTTNGDNDDEGVRDLSDCEAYFWKGQLGGG
mmetsp:Transcript_34180/g.68919  ORF Transcript_34180/g.68919 Transcript_34180/m.68919 type:complete len:727 (+) Transcript_34180:67-2247(+)